MNYVIIVVFFLVLAGLFYKKDDIIIALQGDVGEQGLQGLQGSQGISGAEGESGAQGSTGAVGAIGLQGIPGIPGIQGLMGLKGIPGDIGPQGLIGPAGILGKQGIQGPVGAPGPRGNIGDSGPTGETGDIGQMGKVGMNGPKGSSGPIGPIGPMGKIGMMGKVGGVGPVGPQGVPGVPGPGWSPSTLALMNQQVNPYFSAQKCSKIKINGPSFHCPSNQYLSGFSMQGGKPSSAQCCYGIGGAKPVPTIQPMTSKQDLQRPHPITKPGIVQGKPQQWTGLCPPGVGWRKIGKPRSPNECRHITGKVSPANYIPPPREKYTPLGQVATAPNIMNAQRSMVEQESRAIQLRNLLGTGRQLVTEGNRPLVSGGGTVLRVGAEASPGLMNRIRIAERGPVPDSFLGTGR